LSKLISSNGHATTLVVLINLAWKNLFGPWFENHYFPSSFCIERKEFIFRRTLIAPDEKQWSAGEETNRRTEQNRQPGITP
jgi:hypothetical protein